MNAAALVVARPESRCIDSKHPGPQRDPIPAQLEQRHGALAFVQLAGQRLLRTRRSAAQVVTAQTSFTSSTSRGALRGHVVQAQGVHLAEQRLLLAQHRAAQVVAVAAKVLLSTLQLAAGAHEAMHATIWIAGASQRRPLPAQTCQRMAIRALQQQHSVSDVLMLRGDL